MMKSLFLLCILAIPLTTGAFYWQQRVDTRIEVRLDDRLHMLHGYEQISYRNNSPDTLHFLYLHLWPNAYKDDRSQFSEQQVQQYKKGFYFSKEEDKGYIDSLHFSINGESADYYFVQDNLDIIRIDLATPLAPGGSLEISTPFRVKIPKVVSRLGHTGQAYFISQWFPKPAVYDAKGWHPMPYLDQGEFYSEIGSYDVRITLPRNYVVMATGNCNNPEEEQWLDSLSQSPPPPDTLYTKSWPASSSELKTLHFTEDNIHDFAWFADKRWMLRKDTISGEGNEGVTTLYTAFPPRHQKQWAKGTEYLKATIRTYGTQVGRYPYRTMKAVEGDMSAGGGMEYPTVTVIDRSVVWGLKDVLVHEAGHNWFYGILASNEREHAWMDEGMNSFYEQKTTRAIAKADTAKNKRSGSSSMENLVYYQSVAMGIDQAIEQQATAFLSVNYGGDVYYKSAMLLHWLEAYMGQESFRNAIQEYYDTWKHKHPYPEDFRAIIRKHCSRSTDWFFDGALHTEARIDFALRSVQRKDGSLQVRVKNRSDFAAPAGIEALVRDSVVATVWSEPFTGSQTLTLPGSLQWERLRLAGNPADIKTANNDYQRKSFFHKGLLHVKGLTGINRSSQSILFLAPALGYNLYDGFGAGLLLHNLGWPQNRFQFALAPMFSFGSGQFNGAGSVSYSWYPQRVFKEVRLQTDAKTFSYNSSSLNITAPLYTRYVKMSPYLQLVFRERDRLSNVTRRLTLKAYAISEEAFRFDLNPTDSLYRPSKKTAELQYYGLLRYEHRNNRSFHPFSYSFEAQTGKGWTKLGLEANLRIDYDIPRKSLYIRGFAGKFFSNGRSENARYFLNTTYSGINDYLYDGTYLGRSEQDGFAARQISVKEGGFTLPTNMYSQPLGRSDNWLLAINVKTDLPFGKLPLRLFLDAGTFADARNLNPKGNTVSFVGGLELHLFQNQLSIYAPLFMSSDYQAYLKEMYGTKRFGHSITFSINLRNGNVLRAPEYVFQALALQP